MESTSIQLCAYCVTPCMGAIKLSPLSKLTVKFHRKEKSHHLGDFGRAESYKFQFTPMHGKNTIWGSTEQLIRFHHQISLPTWLYQRLLTEFTIQWRYFLLRFRNYRLCPRCLFERIDFSFLWNSGWHTYTTSQNEQATTQQIIHVSPRMMDEWISRSRNSTPIGSAVTVNMQPKNQSSG